MGFFQTGQLLITVIWSGELVLKDDTSFDSLCQTLEYSSQHAVMQVGVLCNCLICTCTNNLEIFGVGIFSYTQKCMKIKRSKHFLQEITMVQKQHVLIKLAGQRSRLRVKSNVDSELFETKMVFPIPGGLYPCVCIHRRSPWPIARSRSKCLIDDTSDSQSIAAIIITGIKIDIALLSQFLARQNSSRQTRITHSLLQYFGNFSYHMSICTKIYQHEKLTREKFVTQNILKLR